MNATPKGWRAQIAWGALLAIAAGWAVSVDVQNNYTFGMTISEQAARGLVLAALLVAILPGAASFHRWTPVMRGATAICLGLTIWAAAMNYGNGGGAIISAATLAKDAYTSADAAKKRAEAELNANKRHGQVDKLKYDVEEAKRKRTKECGKSDQWSMLEDCKNAITSQNLASKALSETETYNAAEAALKMAEAKLADLGKKPDGAKVEANMITALIAGQLGKDDTAVMRWAIFAVEAALIVAMQAAALLFGYAVELIGEGWKERPRSQGAAAKAKKPAPTGGTQAPLPSNVVLLDAHRHSVKAWLDGSTVAGGMLRGGEALKAYKRFAGRMAASMTAQDLRSIMEALLPGAVEPRNSGYIVRGLQLRTAAVEEMAAL